jgi:hypothetical protein
MPQTVKLLNVPDYVIPRFVGRPIQKFRRKMFHGIFQSRSLNGIRVLRDPSEGINCCGSPEQNIEETAIRFRRRYAWCPLFALCGRARHPCVINYAPN